jgi:predicted RNA-binding protein YlxR (DUF448 family)
VTRGAAPARREPERTCVGCRVKAGKAALVRVVRAQEGIPRIDPTGRAPGRGAYVHPSRDCLDQALRRGALFRALRVASDPRWAASLVEAFEPVIAPDAGDGHERAPQAGRRGAG